MPRENTPQNDIKKKKSQAPGPDYELAKNFRIVVSWLGVIVVGSIIVFAFLYYFFIYSPVTVYTLEVPTGIPGTTHRVESVNWGGVTLCDPACTSVADGYIYSNPDFSYRVITIDQKTIKIVFLQGNYLDSPEERDALFSDAE